MTAGWRAFRKRRCRMFWTRRHFLILASIRPEWDAVRERVLAYVTDLTQAELEASVSVAIAGRYSEPQRCRRRDVCCTWSTTGPTTARRSWRGLHELGAQDSGAGSDAVSVG